MVKQASEAISEITFKNKTIQLQVLWDGVTCWLSISQLALLFQVSSVTLNSLIKKVLHNHPETKYNHSKKMPVIKMRKCANSDMICEWIYHIHHYDYHVIKLLNNIKPTKNVDDFLHFIDKQKSERSKV